VKSLGRLGPEKSTAILRSGDFTPEPARAFQRIRDGQCWNGPGRVFQGIQYPVDNLRRDEGAGGIVHQHMIGSLFSKGTETVQYRLAPFGAARDRRRETEAGDGLLIERPMIWIDDDTDGTDGLVCEEPVQRMPQHRFARKLQILFRNLAAKPGSTAGGDDQESGL
jgi:hypothetical protein